MDFAANHVGFVLAAYGLSAVVLGVATATVVLRYRYVTRRLGELQASGAPRRRRATEPRT
ncbi:MAG TPA: heme exporter protein CcmD [Aestuariivirgaceae bacterium]|nr:heme exporter protein CcmD [Aestuariivirgaceae bacterium]